ncbi:MAG: hypothetical protein Q7T10_14540 [Rhodoferax sp.]|uniref:hypothetical protein n=1 Tax=Rhodoferax sp. TaxID=50421 RepID=UPI00271DC2BC|nr:hypothetical protein [Rhodoferax sp.]MDO8450013.1 hypothetical protein [Rhodoferax sp.]
MSAITEAINALNRRLVHADAIGEAFALAGGESAPVWVHVYREQVEAIREAAEAVEVLLNRESVAA